MSNVTMLVDFLTRRAVRQREEVAALNKRRQSVPLSFSLKMGAASLTLSKAFVKTKRHLAWLEKSYATTGAGNPA